MRINHDCVRKCLLYVEENTTPSHPMISGSDLIDHFKEEYSKEDVINTVVILRDAGFIKKLLLDDSNYPHRIFDLTWEGRQYLDDIRDSKAWDMVKNGTFELSSMSLDVIKELAKELLLSWGKNKIGLK